MSVNVTTEATPVQFAASLRQLATVDWARCWRGYHGVEPRGWVAQFGWRLERVDFADDLWAELPSGSRLHLKQSQQPPHPYRVDFALMPCWSGRSQSTADNGALVDEAERVWGEYVAAGRGILGTPDVEAAWDDPTFPSFPTYPRDRISIDEHRPLRVAVWPLSASGDAIARAILDPARGTVTRGRAGFVVLRLEISHPGGPGGG